MGGDAVNRNRELSHFWEFEVSQWVAAVAADDDRAAFTAARGERDQQVGGLALERGIADLVDDQEAVIEEVPGGARSFDQPADLAHESRRATSRT
jgi:hypothetical protein